MQAEGLGQGDIEVSEAVQVASQAGIVGGISIQLSEVKFLDLLKTNYCESICQGCFH